MGALKFLTVMVHRTTQGFFDFMQDLAEDADSAKRGLF